MARTVSSEGVKLIERFEGLVLEAYQCPGGKWTIGYGHTEGVHEGMKITKEQAEELLRRDLAEVEKAIAALVEVPLSQNQFDALASFVFNVGIDAFERSTLLRKLNAGDYAAVPVELMRWVYAGGKRVDGLVNRRVAEAGLWSRGAGYAPRAEGAEARLSRPADVFATDTGKAASAVGAAGMLVTAAQPALSVIAGLPPWLGVVVIVAVLAAVLAWRYARE